MVVLLNSDVVSWILPYFIVVLLLVTNRNPTKAAIAPITAIHESIRLESCGGSVVRCLALREPMRSEKIQSCESINRATLVAIHVCLL